MRHLSVATGYASTARKVSRCHIPNFWRSLRFHHTNMAGVKVSTLLPLLFGLLAVRIGLVTTSPPAVADRWLARVEGNALTVERTTSIPGPLADLHRGSPYLEPESLEDALRRQGAAAADCSLRKFEVELILICEYALPLASDPTDAYILLPDLRLLDFLSAAPVQTALPLTVVSSGRLETSDVITALPADPLIARTPSGSALRAHFALLGLRTLKVTVEATMLPGETAPFFSNPLSPVQTAPQYVPSAAAWLALLIALLAGCFAVLSAWTARARFTICPSLWHPDLRRLPPVLRPLIVRLVLLVNWVLRRQWLILNHLAGGGLTLLGAQWLFLGWQLARAYNTSGELPPGFVDLLTGIPLAGLADTVNWPGWPFLTVGLGVGMIAIGAGMLRWRRGARIVLNGALAAALMGWLLVWPRLLLFPVVLPFQLDLTFWLGLLALAALVWLVRTFSHPALRYLYATDGELPQCNDPYSR